MSELERARWGRQVRTRPWRIDCGDWAHRCIGNCLTHSPMDDEFYKARFAVSLWRKAFNYRKTKFGSWSYYKALGAVQ